jgi:hypothetical protein
VEGKSRRFHPPPSTLHPKGLSHVFETDYRTLSMMIAPALFMTATGSLILSSNQRLARIVDRIRVLIDLCDKLTHPNNTLDFPELRQTYILGEIQHLHSRTHRIRTATALLYLSFALFVAASLSIGVDLFLAHKIAVVPTILALVGVCTLLWACINLFQEARTATHTIKLEFEYFNRLQAERKNGEVDEPKEQGGE